MANIKVLIVEDDELYAEQLKLLVEEMGYIVIGHIEHSKDFLKMAYALQPDLILMDIHLPGTKNGIELAQQINSRENIPIIFITSFGDDQTFESAKSSRPFAFILKPFSKKKLQRTIELAVSRLVFQEGVYNGWKRDIISQGHFYVKVSNKLEKLKISNILYIEVMNKDCTIHSIDKQVTLRIPLTELLEKLSDTHFIRIHRSFLVNLEHVDSVDLGQQVIQVGKAEIPFSKTYKEDMMKRINLIL